MKRTLFLALISLLAISCLIQAQDKKTTGKSTDSNNIIIIDDNVKGGTGNQLNSNKVYTVVEQMPKFPGGNDSLLLHIARNIKYPSNESIQNIEGKVICRFIVNKDGSISNIEIIRGLDTLLDKAALDVIKSLPNFIPGKQNGVNVSVWYIIPIHFKPAL